MIQREITSKCNSAKTTVTATSFDIKADRRVAISYFDLNKTGLLNRNSGSKAKPRDEKSKVASCHSYNLSKNTYYINVA